MPRTARNAPGGFVYHVLNRACGRATLFEKEGDFDAFERVIDYAIERDPTRILGYIVMPNHCGSGATRGPRRCCTPGRWTARTTGSSG